MPEKVKLGGAGTDKQNLLSVFERFRDVVEEVLRILGVLPSFARTLRVAVHVPRGRMDGGLVEGGWMDVKDPCFLLIEPDDGVFGHNLTSANSKSAHAGAILMKRARTPRLLHCARGGRRRAEPIMERHLAELDRIRGAGARSPGVTLL